MTKDFEVTVKVRNNRLLTKMRESGFATINALGRASGVSPPALHNMLAMSRPGRARLNGLWRPSVQKLADFLGCMPEDIIPEAVRENPLARNTARFVIDAPDAHMLAESLRTVALPADDRLNRKEMVERVDEALRLLSARDERLLRMRFGIGCDEKTLEEVADEWGLTRERIRQIEAQAIRKLKHPTRVKVLREALPD